MMSLLDEYLTYLRAERKSRRTVDERAYYLRGADFDLQQLCGVGLEEASSTEIARYMAEYGNHWRPWTACTYYTHLNAFYRWAVDRDEPYLLFNPMRRIAKPKTPHTVAEPATTQDITIALAMSSGQWHTIILLAAYGSLRCADIYYLDRRDVTQESIRVRGGKGGKDAVLPCHPLIWAQMAPLSPGWVVRDPRPSSEQALSASARRYFDRLGLRRLHLHGMRHWYATSLLQAGVDVRAVQTLMRHSNLATTAGYLHVTDAQRSSAIATLPVLTPGEAA